MEVLRRYSYTLSDGQKWNVRCLKHYLPPTTTWMEILGGTADPVSLNAGERETPEEDRAMREDDTQEGTPEPQPEGSQCEERCYPERVFMPPERYIPDEFRPKKKRGKN